jgi:hypothetical protein
MANLVGLGEGCISYDCEHAASDLFIRDTLYSHFDTNVEGFICFYD